MDDQPMRSHALIHPPLEDELRFLTRHTACRVDEALRRLGPYGEVRLVVVKGRLRFIQTVRSEDVDSLGGGGGTA
jgi:hypothetical protein